MTTVDDNMNEVIRKATLVRTAIEYALKVSLFENSIDNPVSVQVVNEQCLKIDQPISTETRLKGVDQLLNERYVPVDGADGAILVRTDEVKKIIVERVNSGLSFEGRTASQSALETSPVWQVKRISVSGKKTTTEFANGGKYDQIFANRATIFPAVIFNNGFSLNFDGINDRVEFGDKFKFDHPNAWSFSCWIKPDNIAARRAIYSKSTPDANVYGWVFYIDTGGFPFLQVRSTGVLSSYTGAASFTAGAWQHFCFTFSGNSNMNGIRVYRNAVVDVTPGSTALTGTLLQAQNAMLGSRNGSFTWSGNIDEVAIWNKALSQTEVSEIYNGGAPFDVRTATSAGSLTNFYRMGDSAIFPTVPDQVNFDNGTMVNMLESQIQADVP